MNVGLITYHSAYNFGSALQAYATQKVLESLGYQTEIINYRMMEQDYYYKRLYRTKYGIKQFIKDFMQFPIQSKRKERMSNFEKFFSNMLNLSRAMSEPEEVTAFWQKYDVIVSGSDQIWNKHSCEMEHNDWKYMHPYLLKEYRGKKVSYASSIANMTDDELLKILPLIRDFNCISVREKSSAEKLAALVDSPVYNVLDPTFLLSAKDWIKNLDIKGNNEKFILCYMLYGMKAYMGIRNVLSKLSERYNCRVKVISPFAYIPSLNSNIEICPEFGPYEFLESIYNAQIVITNSYHGTILSVNFNKDVYSICTNGSGEFRKTDILERLGLQDRIIYDPNDIAEKKFEPIDYDKVNEKLNRLREHSLNYLKSALK